MRISDWSSDVCSSDLYSLDDVELPVNSGRDYEGGNMAHRPRAKGGYFPVAPVDSCVDLRGEMVSTMLEMGLPCDKHHHEVAAAQHELGLEFGTRSEEHTSELQSLMRISYAVFCL